MSVIEVRSTTIDKSTWPRGPWDREPDEVEWEDETTGRRCLMVRSPMHGAWCGYADALELRAEFERIETDPKHGEFGRWSSLEMMQQVIPLSVIQSVDYGLTFAGARRPGDMWLGLDFAHYDNYQPGLEALNLTGRELAPYSQYVRVARARENVVRLAAALHAFLRGRMS